MPLILILTAHQAYGQVSILDSAFTFHEGKVKTGTALGLITKQTGFYFTFDSKLVDIERKRELTFKSVRLSSILDSLLTNDSLRYSVINKYIIIYKADPEPPAVSHPTEWVTKNITGTITDFETGEPLSFATLGIIRTGKGTVTNSNGEFVLKITHDCLNDSLTVSYLGYINRTIPVRQALGNNFNIRMKREFISIPEIVIRNQMPQEIVRKAYNGISKNYGTAPANLSAFYREAVLKKNLLQIYSEAILQIYKSSYTGLIPGDQVKILKSRKLENAGSRDTLTIRLKAGLSSCLLLDGAKNPFDFIQPENFSQYDYRMTDIVTIDDESAYAVEFEQKPSVDIPLFKGTVYINTGNFAIVQAEFEINPSMIQKTKDEFVSYQSRGYSMWPVAIRYFVNYRRSDNRYVLNHVRGDLRFIAKKKSKLFGSYFDVFFEMAVTDVSTRNVSRFERSEIAPIYSIFSNTISSYDPTFWGNQDFLKPEDNLLQALKNMKVKMQLFSKEDQLP
ncbi:MAG TPA: carboxypeptidase-like regulatory domain-containing protein [Bacteroidales bacterium]|nr:carboxypeptidase-like regulatory domain-containing protein [Bacteroidales bacterium]